MFAFTKIRKEISGENFEILNLWLQRLGIFIYWVLEATFIKEIVDIIITKKKTPPRNHQFSLI